MKPFSNGTEYLDWDWRNCGECARDLESCEIYQALLDFDEISDEIAELSGLDKQEPDCREKVGVRE